MENPPTAAVARALRFGFSILAVFVALNLPWRYGEFASEVIGEQPDSNSSLYLRSFANPGLIQSGWPLRYVSVVQSLESPESSMDWRFWSSINLVVNLTIAIVAMLFVAALAYVWRYLAVAAIVVALFCWGYFCREDFHRDQRLGQVLKADGVVYRSAYIPIRFARLMPPQLQAFFSRTYGVMLYRPTEKNVSLATSISTLRCLGLNGKLPSGRCFESLIDKPRLHQLTIIQSVLEPDHIAMIGKQVEIQDLALISCKGLRGALKDIQDLPDLKRVNLSGSEVDLDALADSRWANSVCELVLAPQLTGNHQLQLMNWRKLESFGLRINRGGATGRVMKISLDGMPELHTLSLISVQKLDLQIINAPHLKDVRIDDTDEHFAGPLVEKSPTKLWLERLHLRNVASLRQLSCYGMDLLDLKIEDAPNLIELTIDAVLHAPSKFQKHPRDQHRIVSKIIADLGQCDGPPIINLATVPLAGIDLTALCNNKRIRELRLAGTGVTGDQLLPIFSLQRLTALDLRGCPISNEDAERALDRLPLLRELLVEADRFSRLEVINRDQLVQFTTTPMPSAAIVRIQGSPRIQSELILGDRLKELLITDAGALRGLSVNGPLPEGTRIDGLRDLRFCALGGVNVDDRLCGVIWQCPKLDHLTLAHTSLSRDAFLQIGQLKGLATLILPGADIDDSVTANWRELKQLSEVDFSYTKISRGTFQFLMSLKNLQRLAINHAPIDREELTPLAGLAQLIELEVAGIGLDDNLLESLLKRGMLDRLELSDCELSGRAVSILASPVARSLVFLGIRNCGLIEGDVQQILDSHPQLVVDVSGHSLSDDFIDKLNQENRLVSRQNRSRFLYQLRRYNRDILDSPDEVGEVIADTMPGRINIDQFMPANRADTR